MAGIDVSRVVFVRVEQVRKKTGSGLLKTWHCWQCAEQVAHVIGGEQVGKVQEHAARCRAAVGQPSAEKGRSAVRVGARQQIARRAADGNA